MLSAVLAAPLELKHDKDVEVYTEQDLTTVRYSGDGRRVAAASFDGGITMWDSRWFRTTAECNPDPQTHQTASSWGQLGRPLAFRQLRQEARAPRQSK